MEEIIEKKPNKIIIIDDENTILELLGEVIRSLGYEPILCEYPKEAIEIYRQQCSEIVLIILDMIMPQLSGRQLYQELMKIDDSKNAIVLSGYAIEEEIQKLIQEGIYGFLQKPISVKELSEIVEAAINFKKE